MHLSAQTTKQVEKGPLPVEAQCSESLRITRKVVVQAFKMERLSYKDQT